MGKINKLGLVVFCSIVAVFPFGSIAGPADNVKCYEVNFQSVAELCTDNLFGFFKRATLIRKDGSKCHLDFVHETAAHDIYSEGYYYSLATFAAKDTSIQLLRLRYVPSGYEQASYDAVALGGGKWLVDFDLEARTKVESNQCANLKEAGFYD